MNRSSFTALTEQGKSIKSLNGSKELLNISVKACFLELGMRYPAIPCWMGNAHFLSSYHSLRNISLELCVIIIIFSFGRMRWLRSAFCADQIITSSINSVIDPLLPSKSTPKVLFQQANPHTGVLNLTSLSQAGVRFSWCSRVSGLRISSEVGGKEVRASRAKLQPQPGAIWAVECLTLVELGLNKALKMHQFCLTSLCRSIISPVCSMRVLLGACLVLIKCLEDLWKFGTSLWSP